MPKGYFIGEVDITNPDGYEGYRAQVVPTVQKYGGRFLTRGGDPKLIEGSNQAKRIVILEFDSPEQAAAWYNSPEYQAILPIRMANSTARAHILTGI